MMKVYLHHKSLVDVVAEATAIPMDGSAKGMGGNILGQWIEHIGQDYWAEIEESISFPFPNGASVMCRLGGTESMIYTYAFFLGTLTPTPGGDPVMDVGQALLSTAVTMDMFAIRRLAVPLLAGGPRLAPERALLVMLDVADQAKRGELHIAIPDRDLYEMALTHVPSHPDEAEP